MAHITAPLTAQTAREMLDAHGWIAARNESFRHLPPPALSTWLDAAQTNDNPPSPGNGWTLQPWGTQQPMGEPGAQWLDSQDSTQRAALFADLTAPAASDAAPFAWAHRALCQGGLRLRVPATAQTTWLQLQHAAQSVVEAPLLVLDVPDGAHCVLLETHTRGAVPTNTGLSQNLQVQVQLGKGAVLHYICCARVPEAPACFNRLQKIRLARPERNFGSSTGTTLFVSEAQSVKNTDTASLKRH